jgi:hypothetical protein
VKIKRCVLIMYTSQKWIGRHFGRLFHKRNRVTLIIADVTPTFCNFDQDLELLPRYCCETAGFSWVLQYEPFEWISLNECRYLFRMRGMAFIPNSKTRHTRRKECYDLLTEMELSRCNFFKFGQVDLT